MPNAIPANTHLLLSCEHGGNKVPKEYRQLFESHAALLQTHRGWDPGTRHLGEAWSAQLNVHLHLATTTRLLIDLNRSEHHPQLFSELSRPLASEQKESIKEIYYRPHRQQIENAAATAIAAGKRVLHIGLHSFTPVLNGEVRNADVSFLYDPRRTHERSLCEAWRRCVMDGNNGTSATRKTTMPALRVRLNYPYRGAADGLTTTLRKRFDANCYLGIELEINQQWVASNGRIPTTLAARILDSLVKVWDAM